MRIAIIRAGAMGGALAEGLLKGNIFLPKDVTIANPHEDKLKRFAEIGASITTENQAAIIGADIVVIAVKPQTVRQVLEDIKPSFDPESQVLVNMAANIGSTEIQQWLENDHLTIFQVIPNTAIAQRCSMTFIAPIGATAEQTAMMEQIFDDLGKTYITDEAHLEAGTVLASCGIAYAMRYIRAAAEGGVELGFSADVAKDIVLQTVKGAVALLQASGNHPEAEIDKVTTAGGTTIKGLNEMEHAGFTSAVIRGLKAASE